MSFLDSSGSKGALGSEAMEGVIKTARQYFYESGQPQRKNFIARQLSFHGNTVATLSLAYHPTRRAPYAALFNHDAFHHVSPAYAARFKGKDESEEEYVERLRKELEDKFLELGPETVIGCTFPTSNYIPDTYSVLQLLLKLSWVLPPASSPLQRGISKP